MSIFEVGFIAISIVLAIIILGSLDTTLKTYPITYKKHDISLLVVLLVAFFIGVGLYFIIFWFVEGKYYLTLSLVYFRAVFNIYYLQLFLF